MGNVPPRRGEHDQGHDQRDNQPTFEFGTMPDQPKTPHYTNLADSIPTFDPKLNDCLGNFQKLTSFVRQIRFKFPTSSSS